MKKMSSVAFLALALLSFNMNFAVSSTAATPNVEPVSSFFKRGLNRVGAKGHRFLQKSAVALSVGIGTILGRGLMDDVQEPPVCEMIRPNSQYEIQEPRVESTFIPTAPSHPYFAEFCFSGNSKEKATGQKPRNFRHLRNFKAKLAGMATHGLIFVQGLELDKSGSDDPGYLQTLKVSKPAHEGDTPNGVGLSTNFYTKNAFTVTPGRHFVFYGGMDESKPFTKESKNQMVKELVENRYTNGVNFKKNKLPIHRSGPKKGQRMERQDPGVDEILTKWDFGWSWGIGLAHPLYCSRIPLSLEELNQLKDYLNEVNHQIGTSAEGNEFNILTNNCSHRGVNMLAELGILNQIPTSGKRQAGRISHPAAVPMDIMSVANETSLDVKNVYYNHKFRRKILEEGELPTRPGTVLNFTPVYPNNQMFEANEGHGWFPFVHNATGPSLGLGAQFFTNRPYYHMLQKKKDTDLKTNLEYHLSKIGAALADVEKYKKNSRPILRGEKPEQFFKFIDRYQEVLIKKQKEIEAWSAELK